MELTVLSGLATAWRFATCPTTREPSFWNATTEGVVREPSAFAMTTGSPPSITATHEFVVPKSIPITFAIIFFLFFQKIFLFYHNDLRKPKHLAVLFVSL